MSQYTSFYLGDNLFGINVLLIREINRNFDITSVDPAPDFVLGLMNLRGQIVTIVDLGVRLGLSQRIITENTCCIVLKTNHELSAINEERMIDEKTSNDIIGLLIDRIGDMITVPDELIEPTPANMHSVDNKYLKGVITLEKELMTLVKIHEILTLDSCEEHR